MKDHKDMKARLERELEELNRKGTWSSADLDNIKDIASAIKNLCRIAEMDDDEEEGSTYSRTRGPMYRRGYSMGGYYPMYPDGMSYAPDGGYSMGEDGNYSMYRGQRRDSMGRYSRHSDGEHMSRDDMIADLRRMLGEATAEKDRSAILSAINAMEK